MSVKTKQQARDHNWYVKNKTQVLEAHRIYRLNNIEATSTRDRKNARIRQERRVAEQPTQVGLWNTLQWKATLGNIREKAKKKNLAFNLTATYMISITPTHCPVLGLPLKRCKRKEEKTNSPSVDRLIPHLGYVEGNVIVVSQLANAVRSNATPEQIIAVGEFYRNKLKERTAE